MQMDPKSIPSLVHSVFNEFIIDDDYTPAQATARAKYEFKSLFRDEEWLYFITLNNLKKINLRLDYEDKAAVLTDIHDEMETCAQHLKKSGLWPKITRSVTRKYDRSSFEELFGDIRGHSRNSKKTANTVRVKNWSKPNKHAYVISPHNSNLSGAPQYSNIKGRPSHSLNSNLVSRKGSIDKHAKQLAIRKQSSPE